jgi:glycosyltransferase involved in cell wall biosynthesis
MTIRIASVPSGHVYVRHLQPARLHSEVVRLPDPDPAVPDPAPGQWWPPTMLSPEWIRTHADEFDVFHVHFGFDALSTEQLQDVVDTLRALDKPLVYTVHDLRNPHHQTPEAHDAHLDVLIPAAAQLITLTTGAAAEILLRWNRRAQVLPHPHVVEFERMQRARPDHDDFVIGVHAKSLRPSMDPIPVVTQLLALPDELPGARVVVDVHPDVFDEDGARHDVALRKFLLEQAERGALELAVHDCFTDDELWKYFESLDVSVLPYRFGTHSGWLESCYDLGTPVVLPDVGYMAEQRPCARYRHDVAGPDGSSLRAAVRQVYFDRPTWRASVVDRADERDAVALAHDDLYRAVL